MGDLLFNVAAAIGGFVGVIAAGAMWLRFRQPAALSGAIERDPPSPRPAMVDRDQEVASIAMKSDAAAASPRPAMTRPAASVRNHAAARDDNGDFLTSALVAGATNSTVAGYLVGGSLSGALLGDALRPDAETSAPPAAHFDDDHRRDSNGWTDTGTSCSFDSSDSDTSTSSDSSSDD